MQPSRSGVSHVAASGGAPAWGRACQISKGMCKSRPTWETSENKIDADSHDQPDVTKRPAPNLPNFTASCCGQMTLQCKDYECKRAVFFFRDALSHTVINTSSPPWKGSIAEVLFLSRFFRSSLSLRVFSPLRRASKSGACQISRERLEHTKNTAYANDPPRLADMSYHKTFH